MTRALALVTALWGCSSPEGPNAPRKDTVTTTTTTGTATGLTTTTTTTGPTTTTTTTFDCSTPFPPSPVPYIDLVGYSDAEDFDFHPDGVVGIVHQTNLQGKDRYGNTQLISPNVSSNAASTRVLSTGDWIIADNGAGQIILVDHLTGGKTSLVSGLTWPNGIEVGSDDQIYATDFSTGRVFSFDAWDPADVTQIDIGQPQANGIGLSPDEQTLYVVLSWTAAVIAYDKQPAGNWSSARVVLHQPGADFQGLTVDACGNIYVTDAYPGLHSYIIRISADETQVENILELPSGYVPNAHFGHDVGGWNRMMLYASDREQGRLFEIDVGFPGKPHPAIP